MSDGFLRSTLGYRRMANGAGVSARSELGSGSSLDTLDVAGLRAEVPARVPSGASHAESLALDEIQLIAAVRDLARNTFAARAKQNDLDGSFCAEKRAIVAWTGDGIEIVRPRAGKGIGLSLARVAIEL